MRNSPIYAALLLSEAVMAFCLGVFGNKVAEILKITTGLIAAGAIVVILLLYLLTLARLRYEAGERFLPEMPAQRSLLLNTVITVFPIGMVGGILAGVLAILFLPGKGFHIPIWGNCWDYELGAWLTGCLLIFLLMRRNAKKLLALTFSAGYALGLSAAILLLESGTNNPAYTFSGVMLAMLAAALVLSFKPLVQFARNFEKAITSVDADNQK
jgi:hypothetical protein